MRKSMYLLGKTSDWIKSPLISALKQEYEQAEAQYGRTVRSLNGGRTPSSSERARGLLHSSKESLAFRLNTMQRLGYRVHQDFFLSPSDKERIEGFMHERSAQVVNWIEKLDQRLEQYPL